MDKHTFFFCSSNSVKQLLVSIAGTKYSVEYRDNYAYDYIDVSSHFQEVSDAILKLEWNKNTKEYEFIIRFFFGETIPQARAFYKNVEIKSLVDLLQSGWRISANLNLSFVSTKLMWIQSPKDSVYFNYWKGNTNNIGQDDKHAALNLLNSLNQNGVVSFGATELKQFNDEFMNTNRNTVNINPAFLIEYKISQRIAMEQDRNGTLLDYIKDKMQEGLAITNKKM